MDIKEQISKVVDKVTKDKDLLASFKSEPVKTVEGIIGKDLPDDVINQVVSGVKTKVAADSISDKVESGLGALKKLF